MTDPEDRPTSSDRPDPSAAPPDAPRPSPGPGGPPANAPFERSDIFEPAPPQSPPAPPTAPPSPAQSAPPAPRPADPAAARWEDVVDPAPVTTPPQSPPDAAPPTRPGPPQQPSPPYAPPPPQSSPASAPQAPPPQSPPSQAAPRPQSPPAQSPPVQARPEPAPARPTGPPGERITPADPETWPEPTAVRRPPAPQPPAARPPARAPERAQVATADGDEEEDYEDDDYDDEPVSRWVSLLATIGSALIGIVTIQVIASLVEGLTLKKGERVGVPDDILHRLGYPFGGLGSTALVFLVLGVVLVSLPSVLDELLPATQDRVVGIALVVAVAMGVVIAVGSLLAVRANLHEYAAKGVSVPAYVRVQFTNFLLGSLGAAALALFGAITAISERGRERAD
ncbi:MAG TPA: hypothetical protein VHT97_12150 [Acidimicrobiales bacterium]|nr:hypothetical protein [Acidimicrobiales bacterium]